MLRICESAAYCVAYIHQGHYLVEGYVQRTPIVGEDKDRQVGEPVLSGDVPGA